MFSTEIENSTEFRLQSGASVWNAIKSYTKLLNCTSSHFQSTVCKRIMEQLGQADMDHAQRQVNTIHCGIERRLFTDTIRILNPFWCGKNDFRWISRLCLDTNTNTSITIAALKCAILENEKSRNTEIRIILTLVACRTKIVNVKCRKTIDFFGRCTVTVHRLHQKHAGELLEKKIVLYSILQIFRWCASVRTVFIASWVAQTKRRRTKDCTISIIHRHSMKHKCCKCCKTFCLVKKSKFLHTITREIHCNYSHIFLLSPIDQSN